MSGRGGLRIVPICIAALLIAAGCGGDDNSEPSSAADEERSYKVAVFEIVPLDIIDDLRNGFKESMSKAGFVEGENITYEQFNAQGEQTNCNTIADQLAQQDWDLVYAIGTGCIQALYQKRPDFPIVFGAMVDPVSAGLADDPDNAKQDTTGSSSMVRPDEMLELLASILPDFATVGTLANPTEANSQAWIDLLNTAVEEQDLDLVNVPVQTTNDVQTGANSLVGRVDAIMIGPDNTLEAGIDAVIRVALENDIPLITEKTEFADQGAFIGMGLDYFELGLLNGEQGVEILNGAEPESLPIVKIEDPTALINLKTAHEIDVRVPEEILSRGDVETIES